MRKMIIVFVLVIIMGVIFFVFGFADSVLRQALESMANQQMLALTNRSITIRKAHLNHRFEIIVEGIGGKLNSDEGSIPFEVDAIKSDGSVFKLFSTNGLTFYFYRFRVANLKSQGVDGIFIFRGTSRWFLDLTGDVKSMDLSELTWADPINLKGAKGALSGQFHLRMGATENTFLETSMRAASGGELGAHFFSLLLPYLPTSSEEQVKLISSRGGLVRFQNGALDMNTVSPSELKVLLRILVPDYNLNLNLNMTVKLDKDNAFGDVAQILGLIKVRK